MAVNSFNAQNPPVTTKGDLFTFSTIPTRLGVGANDTVLTADSSTATGLKWAVPGGALTLSQIATGSLTSGTSLTLNNLSSYDTLQLVVYQVDPSASSGLLLRINNTSTSSYRYTYFSVLGTSTAGNMISGGTQTATAARFDAYENLNPTTIDNGFTFTLNNCKSAGFTTWSASAYYIDSAGSTSDRGENQTGIFLSAAAVSSLVISLEGTNTFQGGTYFLYGG